MKGGERGGAVENFKRITLPFNPSLMKEILNKKITDMLLPKTKTIVEKNTIQMGSAFPPIGWGVRFQWGGIGV